ncbi:MAG TPA: hypothetical protein VLW53_17800, partial [Candidatus Eisenbacteria bacterium]|nr:hypothetical protein [Candidatus Eisenbacteria bacterium]
MRDRDDEPHLDLDPWAGPRREETPEERAARRARQGVQVLLAVTVIGVVLSYALAGLGGLLVALSVVAVAALLATLLAVPAAPPLRGRPRRTVAHENAPFRSYRRVAERLSWATVSPRHYDVVTRPLLQRLLAARLAERHGIDLHRSPAAARELVGAELWPWLDPGRPADESSHPPGLEAATL